MKRAELKLVRAAVVLVLASCTGVAEFGSVIDSGVIDSGVIDSGVIDSGVIDSGVIDSGVIDSGVIDSGAIDSGAIDSGVTDSGAIDSGAIDSGAIDSGAIDSGAIDSGVIDSGAIDSGVIDSGAIDSGVIDSGAIDSGAIDSGAIDSGAIDSGAIDSGAGSGVTDGGGGKWSMGYYAVWLAADYPASEIEWAGLTHLAVAFYDVQPDATLALNAPAGLANELVTAGHAHNVKVVASIGGSQSSASFRGATTPALMPSLVTNLIALATDAGYDGLDLDWEPMASTEVPLAVELASRLRAACPALVITIPVGAAFNTNMVNDVSDYAALAAVYDQVNLMSYEMGATFSGWKSWHSSPLFHQDTATPTSVSATVDLCLDAGVPAAKLGVGIGFFGFCYSSPVTGPDQPLSGSTIVARDGVMSYANIVTTYLPATTRQWDSVARVPYLGFTTPHAPQQCTYISYEDAQSIAEKATYLKAKGLGGVISWELNEGYLPLALAGHRNPLLEAIRDSVLH